MVLIGGILTADDGTITAWGEHVYPLILKEFSSLARHSYGQ